MMAETFARQYYMYHVSWHWRLDPLTPTSLECNLSIQSRVIDLAKTIN